MAAIPPSRQLAKSVPARSLAAYAIALAYGASFWLVLLHGAEGGRERHEPPFLAHWLRDGTLALPLVAIAVALGLVLASRIASWRDVRSPATIGVITATSVAYLASCSLALANRVYPLIFGSHNLHALPLSVHLLRDGTVVVIANLLVALATAWALALPRESQASSEPIAAGKLTSRATFLKYGAAGVVSSTAVGVGLARLAFPAQAQTPPTCRLYIRDGLVPMIDQTSVYMWGYGLSASSGFSVPGPALVVTEDDWVTLEIANTLNEPHSFAVFGAPGFDTATPDTLPNPTVINDPNGTPITTGAIAPGALSSTLRFQAPQPGTYLYGDELQTPFNRLVGLHGALIVLPKATTTSSWDAGTNYKRGGIKTPSGKYSWLDSRLWVLNEIDPAICAIAQKDQTIDPAQMIKLFVPRYFGIGGAAPNPSQLCSAAYESAGSQSGRAAILNTETELKSRIGDPMLLRIVGAGLGAHSLHFHANHVFVLMKDRDILPRTLDKDLVMLRPGVCKDVIFPFHELLDKPATTQLPFNQTYPMHCHAEMSQTAAGGLYPNGMIGHIEFDIGKPCPTHTGS